MNEPAGEVILYRSDDGESLVQLRAVGGTVWLTRGQMADLYGTTPQNIGQIVSRVLADGEADQSTRNSEFLVRPEGSREVRRRVDIYNLDMVLAVGYRVTTPRAVQFRQWATTVLKEYLVKGFALQDERLKDPAADYFDELLARIRDIRASEKRFYQKVRDLFAATSADYTPGDPAAKTFFATIQNKLIHAVTGLCRLSTVRTAISTHTLLLALHQYCCYLYTTGPARCMVSASCRSSEARSHRTSQLLPPRGEPWPTPTCHE
jgi:hypothetical protein